LFKKFFVYISVVVLPTRYAKEDIQYKDQLIPKGAFVGIFIDAVHKHPDYWKNPEKFDPERFFPENRKQRHHFAFMPFSLGPRQCIGNHFSLMEQRLFLVRLLQKFEVLPAKHTKPHNVDEPIPLEIEMPIPIHFQVRQ